MIIDQSGSTNQEYLAPIGYDWTASFSTVKELQEEITGMAESNCDPGWYTSNTDYMLILPTKSGGRTIYVYCFDVRADAKNALDLPSFF